MLLENWYREDFERKIDADRSNLFRVAKTEHFHGFGPINYICHFIKNVNFV